MLKFQDYRARKNVLFTAGFFLVISISFIFYQSCRKGNGGKISAKFHYTGKDTIPGPSASDTSKYVGLGKYIRSITPVSFRAKFQNIRFMDDWDQNKCVMMEVIENNLGMDDPQRYADFSMGQQVTYQPRIYFANKSGKAIKSKEVNFIYFLWNAAYFHQEINLPAEYKGIRLDQFDWEYHYQRQQGDTAQKNLKVTCDHFPFVFKIFNTTSPGGLPAVYVFGNTDSTFVFNKAALSIDASKDNPYGVRSSPIVRSNQYQPFLFNYSELDDMFIQAVASFELDNLIQIYAGPDNISYTRDDIFVYSPRFWERLKIKVRQE
ncbi:MAG: hypothetical protein JNL57_07545 [Bacteroidetes bacterium]|nr:hypothetical protein [Bacteroidota bacterium]